MKFFKIKLITTDGKEYLEFAAGEDELDAMDKVVQKYKDKEILDVKVV